MSKDRQVVFSRKNKSESEHILPKHNKIKPCKKAHCQGVGEKEATSRFHSEGKSQKPTKRKIVRQKSQSKLVFVKVNEELGDLKAQLTQLQAKYESKRKQLQSLKQVLKNYENKIEQQDKFIKSFNRKSEPNKNLLSEAQNLTRQAVNKYKVLSQEFELYKQQQSIKLETEKVKHQSAIMKLKEEYENKVNRFQTSTSRQQEVFKFKQQQMLNQTDIKLYKEQNRRLKLQNEELLDRIERQQEVFRRKENEFKSNLNKITERVENWEEEDEKIRIIEDQNQQLRHNYSHLMSKYEKRKQKQKAKTKQWAIIFQQFLLQINKLKKQIQISGSNARSENSFQ